LAGMIINKMVQVVLEDPADQQDVEW